jgi:hypothetical protein
MCNCDEMDELTGGTGRVKGSDVVEIEEDYTNMTHYCM